MLSHAYQSRVLSLLPLHAKSPGLSASPFSSHVRSSVEDSIWDSVCVVGELVVWGTEVITVVEEVRVGIGVSIVVVFGVVEIEVGATVIVRLLGSKEVENPNGSYIRGLFVVVLVVNRFEFVLLVCGGVPVWSLSLGRGIRHEGVASLTLSTLYFCAALFSRPDSGRTSQTT